ncbi:hypothetical protein C8Q77DRAFT_338010 [Trametes polyzona]|nr:hypothetical protein C8Q77DRAFT_338010 [Trametes polyzona]
MSVVAYYNGSRNDGWNSTSERKAGRATNAVATSRLTTSSRCLEARQGVTYPPCLRGASDPQQDERSGVWRELVLHPSTPRGRISRSIDMGGMCTPSHLQTGSLESSKKALHPPSVYSRTCVTYVPHAVEPRQMGKGSYLSMRILGRGSHDQYCHLADVGAMHLVPGRDLAHWTAAACSTVWRDATLSLYPGGGASRSTLAPSPSYSPAIIALDAPPTSKAQFPTTSCRKEDHGTTSPPVS